jgi:hypothetical protein
MTLRVAIKQSNYDSVLEPARPGRPAKLTLRLKVLLIPLDPAAPLDLSGLTPPYRFHHARWHLAQDMKAIHQGMVPDGNTPRKSFLCRSWLHWEWNSFKIRFKKQVENVWNDQMVLLPPDDVQGSDGLNDQDYLQFVSDPNTPAHVECALDLELTPLDSKDAHARIRVVHRYHPVNVAETGRFRSYGNLLTDEDLEWVSYTDDRWPNARFRTLVAAHEIGHNFYKLEDNVFYDPKHAPFEHVEAEACSQPMPAGQEDTRDDDCQYGQTAQTRSAIMGAGDQFTAYEAQPWQTRARRHTRVLHGWTPVQQLDFQAGKVQVSARQRRIRPVGGQAAVNVGGGPRHSVTVSP